MDIGRPLRVAVIGSGPSGFYATEHLLGQDSPVEVDVYDRLPTPHGLVRGGVAPDHPKLKSVTRVYDRTATHPGFRFFGNVGIGTDVTVEELREWYDAVVYAIGSASHRDPGVPGSDLPGSVSATDFVGWYNGHPDHVDHPFDLDVERALVVGNGNVALDVARILTRTVDDLGRTDIADHALDKLRSSRIREVVVLGRRGPEQMSFSAQELRELGELDGVDVTVVHGEHGESAGKRTLEVLDELATHAPEGRPRLLVLRFLGSPVEVLGDGRVTGVRVGENELYQDDAGEWRVRPTGRDEVLPVGLVVWAIGYRGEALAGLPFDADRGVVPNDGGRVLEDDAQLPGAYVVGWIKRGPSGLIGANKGCAHDTVDALMEDAEKGVLPTGTTLSAAEVEELLRGRVEHLVTFADWQRLDAHERATGEAQGRPRVKVTSIAEMVEVLEGRR